MNKKAWRISWVLLVAVLAGCKHAPAPLPETKSSVTFLARKPADGDATTRPLVLEAERSAFIQAKPFEPLALPAYPPSALGTHHIPVTIAVHIIVNREGLVSEISQSDLQLSTLTVHSDAFRAAVEVALKQWRFKPAEMQHFRRNEAGGLGSTTEKVEAELDVAFTFSISGKVEQAAAQNKK